MKKKKPLHTCSRDIYSSVITRPRYRIGTQFSKVLPHDTRILRDPLNGDSVTRFPHNQSGTYSKFPYSRTTVGSWWRNNNKKKPPCLTRSGREPTRRPVKQKLVPSAAVSNWTFHTAAPCRPAGTKTFIRTECVVPPPLPFPSLRPLLFCPECVHTRRWYSNFRRPGHDKYSTTHSKRPSPPEYISVWPSERFLNFPPIALLSDSPQID